MAHSNLDDTHKTNQSALDAYSTKVVKTKLKFNMKAFRISKVGK